MVEFSALDRLGGREVYPGPTGKPGFRDLRRLCWYSGSLSLDVKAPVSGEDIRRLWAEIAEFGARRMFADPPVTVLEALL